MPIDALSSESLRLTLWFFIGTASLLATLTAFLAMRVLKSFDSTVKDTGRSVKEALADVLKRIDEAAVRIQGHETRLSRLEGFKQGYDEGRASMKMEMYNDGK